MRKFLSIVTMVVLAVAISSCCGGGNKAKKDCCEAGKEKSCTAANDKSCCKAGKEKSCTAAGEKSCCKDGKAAAGEKSCCAGEGESCCKNKKVVITAYVEIKQDKIDKFLGEVNNVIAKSKEEEGNIAYNLFADLKEKNKFVFVEEWKSQAAVETHFATEHFKKFGTLLDEVAASPANIKIFPVAAEK